MKYSLKSSLSDFFLFVAYCMGIGIIGFIIFFIIEKNISPALFCFFIFCVLYFKIYRRSFKYKSITFDETSIYFDDTQMPLQSIIEIEEGKITLLKDGNEVIIYYNFFFSSNYNRLKTLVKEERIRQMSEQES